MVSAHEMKGGLLFVAAQRIVFPGMLAFIHWFTSLPHKSRDRFNAATAKRARRLSGHNELFG